MVNLKNIGQSLLRFNLMNKSFSEMDKEEIAKLIEIILSSFDSDMPPDGWKKPTINERGTLSIPLGVHPDYHWWKYGAKSIKEMLEELNAPEEIFKKYVNETDYPPF